MPNARKVGCDGSGRAQPQGLLLAVELLHLAMVPGWQLSLVRDDGDLRDDGGIVGVYV